MNEPPSGRVGSGEPDFSEAYLVSARYGECRCVAGKVLSIFQIACGINESIVNRRPPAGCTFADLSLADVLAMVPNGRRYAAPGPSKPSSADREAYLTVQPILLIRLKGFSLILDGLKRLQFLQGKGSDLVRCVQINEKRAFYFGREGIDVFDGKGRSLERDKKQRTLRNSVPPSIDAPKPYPAKAYHGQVRPALAKMRRDALPALPEDEELASIAQMIERDRYVIEGTYLTTLAPHLATVEHRRIQMTMEMTPNVARTVGLDTRKAHQLILDRDIKVGSDVFGHGNAGCSIYEIILIRFLLRLFDKIEELHLKMKQAGISDRQENDERKYATNPRVGHSIVNEDARYNNAMGRFSDLREKRKDWANIATLTDGVFASGLHDGLFDIGLRRRHEPGDHPLIKQQEHAYELLQSALKALRRAENQTSNLRDLRQHNNGKASKANLRSALDFGVNGEPSVQQSEMWEVDPTFRALLALHARLNPAKIWRDETHLTLMYQWLVVLGDLNRNGSMIVTCHMAQEFFAVHRFRSSDDNPGFNPDWSFFDEALELAVRDHPNRSNSLRELVDLCAAAMRKGRAVRVLLNDEGSKCFEPKPLSPETSELAEAAIWLT